jgi:calcineurin-like phosphoesterase family protein
MDEVIIANWNALVAPEDKVYHLGDIALGPIDKSLSKISRLNGYRVAILGNHDRPFMRAGKADEQDWWDKYREVFDEVWNWSGHVVELAGRKFRLSHFPYTGDHTPTDRHAAHRPADEGLPLIHGHTHSTDRLTFSKKGTPQIHVGQDAWDFRPVSENEILDLLDTTF